MSEIFIQAAPTDELARPLVEQLTDEYQRRYGDFLGEGGAAVEMNRYPAERFAAPDGAFILLLRDGKPIAGGAFMRYDQHTAEFKRMWTDSGHRRQGLAQKVLAELESQAAAMGYTRVYLTTGFRQPEAVSLYLKSGYIALFDIDADPATIHTLPFEKALTPIEAERNERLTA